MRLSKESIVIGFLIKHPSCLVGYISLSASQFTSPEDIKETLTIISIVNIFSHSSKPFRRGITSTTDGHAVNSDNATTGSLAVYTSILLLASLPYSIAALKVVVISLSSSTIKILFQNRCCSLVRVLYTSCFCMSKKENPPDPGTTIVCSSACLTGIDQALFSGNTSNSM